MQVLAASQAEQQPTAGLVPPGGPAQHTLTAQQQGGAHAPSGLAESGAASGSEAAGPSAAATDTHGGDTMRSGPALAAACPHPMPPSSPLLPRGPASGLHDLPTELWPLIWQHLNTEHREEGPSNCHQLALRSSCR